MYYIRHNDDVISLVKSRMFSPAAIMYHKVSPLTVTDTVSPLPQNTSFYICSFAAADSECSFTSKSSVAATLLSVIWTDCY